MFHPNSSATNPFFYHATSMLRNDACGVVDVDYIPPIIIYNPKLRNMILD